MMKISIVLIACLSLALLSSASAFNEQTTNNIPLFNMTAGMNISPALFRTKHGSVYYNSVDNSSNISSSYILLDFNPVNATQILQQVSSACDVSSFYYFSKLYYHEESSSLVYFCGTNNTLLILEEDTFTVQESIPTSFDGDQFNETKITSDGNSIVVIGIYGLYTPEAENSQMIVIDMESKNVTSHVHFRNTVVGFAANGIFKYVIANDFSQNYTVGVTIYHLLLKGDYYETSKLAEYTYVSFHERAYFYSTELFCLGNYVISNDDKHLLIFDAFGKATLNETLLFLENETRSSKLKDVSPMIPYQPLIFQGRGGKTFYANLKGADSVTPIVSRISLNGFAIVNDLLFNGSRLQVSKGNSAQDDLIFTHIQSPNAIQVVSAQDLSQVYLVPFSFVGIMTTDQTYGILHEGKFYAYNFTNNSLLKIIDLIPPKGLAVLLSSYYNVNDGRLYFINTSSTTNCTLQSINLQNLEISTVYNFTDKTFCDATIMQADFNTRISEVVLRSQTGNFLFLTEKYGALNFPAPPSTSSGWISANFTSVSFYLHCFKLGINASYYLDSYSYDASSGQFEMQGSVQLRDVRLPYLFYTSGDNKIFATRAGEIAVIDLSNQGMSIYSTPFDYPVVSVVQDNANNNYIIVSESPLANKSVKQVLVLDSIFLVPLPGSNNKSFTGQASGKCAYYIAEDLSLSIQSIKIHNICQKSYESIIY